MNASQLITYTRYILSESTANVWTDAELLDYINRGYEHAYRVQVMKDRGYGVVAFDWNTTDFPAATQARSDEWTIYLPKFFYKLMEVQNATANYEKIPSAPRFARKSGTWHFSGSNQITFVGESQPTSLRFLVYRNPAPLHVGSISSYNDVENTFVLTATTGDLTRHPWTYQGSIFEMTSGTGQGLLVYGTDFARSSNTLTFVAPEEVTLANSDTYAMVPDMDETHHELLAYLAADRALNKEGNESGKQLIRNTMAHLWQEYINTLVPRTTDNARYVQSRDGGSGNTYDRAPYNR